MDQDLRSRIKAAAQERGIDPEIAVKFAQAESSLNPNAKAKTSSASGLYQVINKTWKEYGGGDKKDVDEQIRVGTDVIASNQQKFKRKFNREPSAAELYAYHVLGPTGALPLLNADPSTPMEKVVSREALNANSVWKGKTVGDVLATYEKKVGGSQKATTVAEQRNTRMKPTNYSFEPLTQLDIDNLGPGYQAAMAAMALADTQGDDEEMIAERIQDAQTDAENSMLAVPASQNISSLDLSYQSPFPQEQAPVMMAKGGEARKMMDAVYRADGSPEYGEISMGDFSGDTRQQVKNFAKQGFKAPTREDARVLAQIPVQAASNVESFTRGSAAALPGMVGDVEAAFRTDPRRQIFPTTEKILKSVPRVTPANERSAGFEEIGTYDIGLPGAALARGASKVPGAIKAAAPVAAVMAERAVPGLLQPMNIVTPSGRVFLSNKTAAEEPISLLDTHIKDTMSWVNLGRNPAAKPASDFLDTKVRAYFKNNAGTVNDEVREALLTGRIKIPKDSPLEEEFPKALIDAARKGDVTAMKILENKLNAESGMMSNIRTKEYGPGEIQAAEASNDTRLAILGQMKNNPNLIPDAMLLRLIGKDVTTMPTKEAAAKVAEVRAKLKENPTLFNTIFEDKIGRLIPENLVKSVTEESAANYPRLYPSLNKAASKQEGIMALEQNAPITDIGINSPRILGLTLRQLMQGAQDIPAKELERMSVADVVGRVLPMQMKLNEAEGMAAKVKKSLASGNPIPEKIATFGTEVTIPADKQGFVWRKIVDPNAAKVQAAFLNNSIGGYAENGTYGSIEKGMSALKKGEVELYSLYNPKGEVVTNVEYITPKATGRKIDEGIVKPNTITQFFGNGVKTGNVSPEDYVYQAENLVRHLNPSSVPNTIKELFRANNISFAK